MIDNTVPSVAASMKDENPDEDESGVRNREGKRVEGGRRGGKEGQLFYCLTHSR